MRSIGVSSWEASRAEAHYNPIFVAVLLSVLLGGCAFVDSSIGPRIGTLNDAYDSADNNEILSNIVRASHSRPLRFYSHSKFAPSQTSDLKIGLPTITLGAGQTAAQKQFIFMGNLTDNSAAVSIEIDPIESRDFHNGILTPISVATIGILLANFPKEMVYLALLDSVRFEQAGGYTIEYKNDPRPPSTKCQSENYTTYDPAYPGQLMLSRYFPPGEGDYADLTNCPYQRFVDWVETAIAYGLSVATKDVPNPKYDPSDTKGTQPKTIKVGRFCLDPAQARPGVFDQLKGLPTALCDEPPKGTEENKPPLMFPFTRGSKQVLATLEFWPRSLVSLFTYLGKILKSEPNDLVVLYNQTAQANDDRALITIKSNIGTVQCFAVHSAYGTDFCVPYEGADNTKRMFALLSYLTSLSFTPNDVPTSLTVRLTP